MQAAQLMHALRLIWKMTGVFILFCIRFRD
jgi:hypothetical protein